MATTYTEAEIFWGSEAGQRAKIHPTGENFKNVIITYPDAAAPYFLAVLTMPDDNTIVIASQNLTIVRPG